MLVLYYWYFCPPFLCVQVRSVFGQVVIAMAHHHYLELEGGHSLIEFVVKQCSIDVEDKVSETRP